LLRKVSDVPTYPRPARPGGKNAAALETPLRLAEQNRARVTALHLIQRIEHVPGADPRGFDQRIEAAARKKREAAGTTSCKVGLLCRGPVLVE
jgi:hypothetical protein